jgi:hypothetical protein
MESMMDAFDLWQTGISYEEALEQGEALFVTINEMVATINNIPFPADATINAEIDSSAVDSSPEDLPPTAVEEGQRARQSGGQAEADPADSEDVEMQHEGSESSSARTAA